MQTVLPKTIVHLRQLKEFDRFVFVKQLKKREVWQVVEHITATIMGEAKLMTRCINDSMQAKRFDANRVVIFLRNNNPHRTGSRIRKADEMIDY